MLHHCSVVPTLMAFILETKVFHGMLTLVDPNMGNWVGSLMLEVVPLWKRKRTLRSSVLV